MTAAAETTLFVRLDMPAAAAGIVSVAVAQKLEELERRLPIHVEHHPELVAGCEERVASLRDVLDRLQRPHAFAADEIEALR